MRTPGMTLPKHAIRSFSYVWRLTIVSGFVTSVACAQEISGIPAGVTVRGTIEGAPSGCSTAAAVHAIQSWFRAVQSGDPADISKGIAADFRSVTISPFAPTETLFMGRRYADLVAYTKARSQQHERLELRLLQFNGWRLNSLQFGPILYYRTADDLGGVSMRGGGKGAYQCGQGQRDGIIVLSIGPVPELRVTCIKSDPDSAHEHITHVGNPSDGWMWSREQVIGSIDAEISTFVVVDPVTNTRSNVGVVREEGKPPYLRTYVDETWNNDLLSLDQCPSR